MRGQADVVMSILPQLTTDLQAYGLESNGSVFVKAVDQTQFNSHS